ncbi:hypothetical protein R1sor_014313 [Riccia sorocarpa]|uniref:SHSP domain-containing protein n=1 Tax=Riccia sorocarpa TaxID=122646 RepID=A0ABD3HBW3_9MARC
MDSSVSRCFLLPVGLGPGKGTRGQSHDALQKSLVFSHSRHGPSARLVLWKNYPEFDSIAVRTKPGDLIRAHLANREISEVDEIENEKQSFLGSLLGRALSTFVHSQLESCSHVEVRIAGSNQELFRGQVKKVKISAKQAVFKGISFSDVKISATSIRLRFGKKRLLQEPLQVKASIAIGEEDFKTSLGSPLLFEHMKELLPRQYSTPKSLSEIQVEMQDGVLLFTLDKPRKTPTSGRRAISHSPSSVAFSLNLEDNGQGIKVSNVQERERSGTYLADKYFKISPETTLKKLRIADSKMLIEGDFLITP